MSAITISRQLGSYGDEVAQALGQRLGFQVVSRVVINQAARRAGVPEVALATIDDLDLFGLRPSQTDREAYHQAVSEVMHELAAHGEIIIIGRAGQVILKDVPEVLHVKVIAPATLRASRIAESEQISSQAAWARIETSDHSRQTYLARYYHVRWDDPELYDLIINTARLNPLQAARLICQSFEHCIKPQTDVSPSRG